MPQAFVQFQYTERFQNRILFSQAIYLCAFYEDITVIRTLSNFNRSLYDQCRTNNISMSMLSGGNVMLSKVMIQVTWLIQLTSYDSWIFPASTIVTWWVKLQYCFHVDISERYFNKFLNSSNLFSFIQSASRMNQCENLEFPELTVLKVYL